MSRIDLRSNIRRIETAGLPEQFQVGRRSMYDAIARLACNLTERSWCKVVSTITDEQIVLGASGPFLDEPFRLELPQELGASDFVDLPDYKITQRAVKTRCDTSNPVRALAVCSLAVNRQTIGLIAVGDSVQTGQLKTDQVRGLHKLATLTSDLMSFRLELRAIAAESLSMLAHEDSI